MYNCERNSLEKYKCKDCNFKSNLVIFSMQHRLHCHPRAAETNKTGMLNPILRSYSCTDCNNFETNSLLHSLKHSVVDCFKPKYVDYPCKLNNLRTDLRLHSSNDSPQWHHCSHCCFKTRYEKSLKNHIRTTHLPSQTEEKNYHKCKVESRINKIHSEHSLEWFECSHCPYKTNYMNKLRTHNIRVHSSDGLEQFEGSHCHDKTNHMDNSESLEEFQCSYCPLKTKYKYYLTRHINKIHRSVRSLESFECSRCSFKTKYKNKLHTHINEIHLSFHNPRNFHCTHCPYKTESNFMLQRHISKVHSLHHDLQCFECPYCQLNTGSKASLTRHLQREHSKLLTSNVDGWNLI